jgi:ABC-type lipopolysaccharide export system ATPase subunit
MSINGIMWSDQNPIAVIAFQDGSSTLAKKGDVLQNGATVSVVEKNRVEVVFQGKKFWIEK